ncbi:MULTISPECIES: UpxY family transcription antiterminator [Flavobacterium]|jgi:transcription antitermination factor NusG|uniref:Antitermination protein NusG n=1 Tax=Flavobacterium pectinovorum TaxID=29533 RepID=A0AB36P5F3_9FLAO|nr:MULTISPECIES: UpxY family transcription antiterminator [Flavobacterium]KIQ18698.1 antitermination protein NusG [Flavobacterium sp. MEB061]OXB07577.1 antitermination protein NusG [Flavobacterium pectinovorum]WKL46007.1 UpxY family transcription antiterminator [Flavobacterium pectinovorum]SHM72796.1 Transcription antitermination factor NusG [Flavobacterium pectinovorum]
MNWYVIYTKPKWEKKVAERLLEIGIESYCPVITQIKQWSDRKKKVEVPLFNSYVFVKLLESERNSVFQISGVVRYLFWLGKPAIVRDEEINIIKKSLSSPNLSDVSVTSIQVGDRITLETGAFSNQDAIVKEVSNTHYILVLESLGCVLKIKYK